MIPPRSSRPHLWFFLALAAVVATSAWLRMPGFTQGGFANHDVGGILYNGMLLDRGLLPYVDSVEFKAPGTFYLASWLAQGGRDIASFQIWANVFGLGSLVAVAMLGWRLWGRVSGIVAAVVYGGHDLMLDTMDANYVTWAQLPHVGAVTLALLGALQARHRAWWFAGAGAAAVGATMLKRPAGVALVVCLAIAGLAEFWVHRRPRGEALRGAARNGLAVLAGGALAFAPLVVHYAAHGEAQTLVRAFILNEWGWRYVAQGSAIGGDTAMQEGVLATTYFLALPLALAAFSAGGAPDRRDRFVVGALVGWALLGIGAAWVGFRFYKGYFLAAAAPLSVLAAAPWGLLGVRGPRPKAVRSIALVPALLLVARQGLLVHAERINRRHAHDRGGRVIAKQVVAKTSPQDRIWVWGWHLWDVYAFTGRLSSTRFYKTMELTTSANDATWRHPRSPLHFRDDAAAASLLEELRADPPEYIVLGSAVPIREFDELRRFLRTHYRRDRDVRLNRVQFWELDGDGDG